MTKLEAQKTLAKMIKAGNASAEIVMVGVNLKGIKYAIKTKNISNKGEGKMLNDAEENKMRLALATAAVHFEALAVILACPLTDEERELSYQQAEKSAAMCKVALNRGANENENKKTTG